MTGLYATQTGCYCNRIALPLEQPTIANLVSDAGYEVGYIGKWHLASTVESSEIINAPLVNHSGDEEVYHLSPVPLHRRGGFRDFWLASDILEFTSHAYDGHMFNADMQPVYFPEGRYRVDAQTDWVIDYLRSRDGNKPFFLFVSYLEPHHQNDHNRYEGPHGSQERFKDFVVPGDLEGTEGDWREQYPDYLGCVNSLDENLGRIRNELEVLGLSENTVIVYTSDHGSHFRTRNDEYKRSCHDASIRIPLIIYGPGFNGGRVVDELISLIDFAPSVLSMAGVEPLEWMPGRPVQNLINGINPVWPEDIFVQISESQVGRALRTHKWKYAVSAPDKDGWKDGASDVYLEEFLYDLENDPFERQNLVDGPTYEDVRVKLRERLKLRMAEAGEATPEIFPAAS
jgi:uncharacterized sulfatase